MALAKLEPGDIDAVIPLPSHFQRMIGEGNPSALELEEMLITRRPEELFAAEDEEDWNEWIDFFRNWSAITSRGRSPDPLVRTSRNRHRLLRPDQGVRTTSPKFGKLLRSRSLVALVKRIPDTRVSWRLNCDRRPPRLPKSSRRDSRPRSEVGAIAIGSSRWLQGVHQSGYPQDDRTPPRRIGGLRGK